MHETKNPFASKTIWGAILVLIGLIGNLFGVDVPKSEIQGLIDNLAINWPAFVELAGAVMAVWGRITATKQLAIRS